MISLIKYTFSKSEVPGHNVSNEENQTSDREDRPISNKSSSDENCPENNLVRDLSLNGKVGDDGYNSAQGNDKIDRLETKPVAGPGNQKRIVQEVRPNPSREFKPRRQNPQEAMATRHLPASREGKENRENETTITGKIKMRKNRDIFLEDDTRINLDKIAPNFVPNVGDYIKLQCHMSISEFPGAKGKISRVKSIHPLEKSHRSGTITEYNLLNQSGIVDGDIQFFRCDCMSGYSPSVGDTVIVDCIKSDQGNLNWRALQVSPSKNESISFKRSALMFKPLLSEIELSELVQEKENVEISQPATIELTARSKTVVEITVKNNGNWRQLINQCTFFNDRNPASQLELLSPKSGDAQHIKPSNEIIYTFQIKANYVGLSKEIIMFKFEKFQIGRVVLVNVKSIHFEQRNLDTDSHIEDPHDPLEDSDKGPCIRGVLPYKPPNFIKNRYVPCRVPDKLGALMNQIEVDNQTLKDANGTLWRNISYLQTPLNFDNYLQRFSCLLFLEEIGHRKQMKKFNMSNAVLHRKGNYLTLNVPGLLEKQPPLISGDRVIVSLRSSSSETKQYEGFIHKIENMDIFLKFDPKFHEIYAEETCFVEFRVSRTIYKRCHSAIEEVLSRLGENVLFPQKIEQKKLQYDFDGTLGGTSSNLSDSDDLDDNALKVCAVKAQMDKEKICWFNERLNSYQKEAVKNILRGIVRPMPYVIFGPPGTGKTMTACEAILQIFFAIPKSQILVVTPSNNSANLIAERLLKSHELGPENMARLVARHYLDSGSIPEILRPYSLTADIAEEHTRSDVNVTDSRGYRTNVTLSVLLKHRIIVGTCSAAGIMDNMGIKPGTFTHIIVDEAGQATEPEVMIPLSLGRSDKTQIILVGDPKQLGPNNKSPHAAHFGLGQSFLARLLKLFPYQRDPQGFETGYDPRFVTKLLENYRSLPDLLALPNQLFYHDELIPKVHRTDSEEAELLENLTEMLPKRLGSPLPIVFHCVYGKSKVDPNTTSWYNEDEYTQVYVHLLNLYDHGLTPDDIGIITPYMKQVYKIRGLLHKNGVPVPKVGSVEDFQGQERQVIILSTVRTPSDSDTKSPLGFVASSERLNVAITRARALLMIVGHPDILYKNPGWKSVLEYCNTRDAMIAQQREDSQEF